MMMNWNEEKRICVSIEDKRKRGERVEQLLEPKKKKREKGLKNMTNDQSARIIAAGFASS